MGTAPCADGDAGAEDGETRRSRSAQIRAVSAGVRLANGAHMLGPGRDSDVGRG